MSNTTLTNDATDPTRADDERHFEEARSPTADDQTLADRDQTMADTDQTTADSDQTAADTDQAASDSDQAASDSDQAASDNDQAASDNDFVHGGDAAAHTFARDQRDRGAQHRQDAAKVRVEAAASRDTIASARDLAAAERDAAAEQRDCQLTARDLASSDFWLAETHATGLDTETARRSAAADRAAAADSRGRAAGDREQASRDRLQAARDRAQAQVDRDALTQQLTTAGTDELTGTLTRAAGLADLEHEIERAHRTLASLAVIYIDVVGLKAVNDTSGHAAGDAMLRHAVRRLRDHLRSYDLVVRLGGDEFLCVMSGVTLQRARERMATVRSALASDSERCEITVGVAALEPDDNIAGLIARADSELPSSSRR